MNCTILCLTLTASLYAAAAPDTKEIVKRAIGREVENHRNLANYTWQTRSVTAVKGSSAKSKTYENFNIDGTSYRKLVEKDGKPLSAAEAREEQEKMDREIAKRRAESPSQRNKRINDERKEREEGERFRKEVLEAFNFTLEGEESIGGFTTWRIRADQRAGFKPASREGKFLSKVQGKIWVDQKSGEWLKFEMETTDKLTWGAFIASIAPGSRIVAQQMRVNDELWHPQWIKVTANARALWKRWDATIDVAYQNFRKFQAESKLIAEAPLP
ncbi:hypothetical protein F183_A42420 [Bryobacterales bacterium F-183]|nr:hypothetical protein F183_A42420 [Bryobacterales bacterium F-183]